MSTAFDPNSRATRLDAVRRWLTDLRQGIGPETPEPRLGSRYEFVREIGRGGTAQVFEVRDCKLCRQLAMKVLLPNWRGERATEARFVREGQILAALQHPGVLPVYDSDNLPDGLPYYTLYLLPGENRFADRLATRPSRASEWPGWRLDRLREFQRVCEAVHYAHSQNVIHRDLKPQNVMVGPFGELFVIDWGLARRLTEHEGTTEPEPLPQAQDEERTGGAGTVGYMAPEQQPGSRDPVGKPADVFALGVILDELLSARVPGATAPPSELTALAAACRAEVPAARPTVDQMVADLKAYFESVERAERHRLRRRWRVAAVVAGLVLMLTAVGFAVYYRDAEQTQKKLADENGRQADEYKKLAVKEEIARIKAESEERSARSRAAALAFERGQTLALGKKPGEGLPWMVRALELIPDDDPLRDAILLNIRHWLRNSPRLIAFLPHDNTPFGLAFSPDGTRLYSAGDGGKLQRWDSDTWKPVGKPLELVAGIKQLVFSKHELRPGEHWLYATGSNKKPYCIDLAERAWPLDLDSHAGAISASALSPDGRYLATAGDDGFVLVRETATQKKVAGYDAFPGKRDPNGATRFPIADAAFSPDGKRLATADADGKIRIREWENDKKPVVLDHDGWGTQAVCYLRVGEQDVLASSDRAGFVHFWDEKGQRLPGGLKLDGPVGQLVPRPGHQGQLLVTGTGEKARIWDGGTGDLSAEFPHPNPVNNAVWTPDGKWFATASTDGVRVWEPPPSGTPERLTIKDEAFWGTRDWSRAGDRVVVAERGRRGRVGVWAVDAVGLRPLLGPSAQEVGIMAVGFSDDSHSVLLGALDGTVRCLSCEAGMELWRHGKPTGGGARSVRSVALSPDGRTYAAGDVGGRIVIGRADTGAVIQTPESKYVPYEMRFSPDGKQLVVISANERNGKLTWLDTATGEPIGHVPELANVPLRLDLSPDGRTVVVGGYDRKVLAFDMTTHQPAGPDISLTPHLLDVRFGPDGQLLMTATADERVRLWHWKTGRPVGPSFPIGGPQSIHVAFSRDGSRVGVLGQGRVRGQGYVQRWLLPGDDVTDLATARRAVRGALGYDVGADDRLTPLTAASWVKNLTAP